MNSPANCLPRKNKVLPNSKKMTGHDGNSWVTHTGCERVTMTFRVTVGCGCLMRLALQIPDTSQLAQSPRFWEISCCKLVSSSHDRTQENCRCTHTGWLKINRTRIDNPACLKHFAKKSVFHVLMGPDGWGWDVYSLGTNILFGKVTQVCT